MAAGEVEDPVGEEDVDDGLRLARISGRLCGCGCHLVSMQLATGGRACDWWQEQSVAEDETGS